MPPGSSKISSRSFDGVLPEPSAASHWKWCFPCSQPAPHADGTASPAETAAASLCSSISVKSSDLAPSMNTTSATLLVCSGIIGAGIFATPAVILNEVGSVGSAVVLWLIGGIAALAGALTYVEWGLLFPNRNGGDQLYLFHAFDKPKAFASFLFSWAMIFLIRPGYSAAISTVSAKYVMFGIWGQKSELLASALELSPSPRIVLDHWEWINKALAALIVTSITLYNALSTPFAVAAQNVLSSTKLLVLVIFCVAGILAMTGAINVELSGNFSGDLFAGSSQTPTDYTTGLFKVFYVFDGFTYLNYCAADLKTPSKSLPIANVVGTGLCVLLFWMVNIAFLAVVDLNEFREAKEVLGGVYATKIFGETFGKRVIPFLIALAAYGCASAIIFGSARITASAGRKNMIPLARVLRRTSKRFETPVNALLLNLAISLALIVGPPGEGAFSFLVDLATYPAWLFYGVTALGLIIFRYKAPDLRRPFKVWLVCAALVALVAVFLVVVPFTSGDINAWLPATISMVLLLAGVPVYLKLRRGFRLQLFSM